MKKLLILFIPLLLFSCDYEKQYCGVVIQKGYEGPTSGYKSVQDPVYFIILKVDSVNKAIRVNVTVPTYYSLEQGGRACFNLSEFDIRYYGNGTGHLIK